jgi:hypothetical protein
MSKEVVLVLAIKGESERPAIFSTQEKAQSWVDTLPEDVAAIFVPLVVDVPEFGNEAQENN